MSKWVTLTTNFVLTAKKIKQHMHWYGLEYLCAKIARMNIKLYLAETIAISRMFSVSSGMIISLDLLLWEEIRICSILLKNTELRIHLWNKSTVMLALHGSERDIFQKWMVLNLIYQNHQKIGKKEFILHKKHYIMVWMKIWIILR